MAAVSSPNLLQAARFALVGLAATAVHAGVAAAMHMSGVSPALLVNMLAFLAAFCVSAASHVFWTFSLQRGRTAAVARFLLVALAGFAGSNAVMALALSIEAAPLWTAQAAAILVVPPISYAASALWAFRP